MTPNAFRTVEAIIEILVWGDRYSPAKMRRTGFFIMVADDALTNANELIKLTATSRELGLLATNRAAIAVVKNSSSAVDLMLYKECWEDKYFYNPRKELLQKLQNAGAGAGNQVTMVACNVY
jgi:hypothetical protein